MAEIQSSRPRLRDARFKACLTGRQAAVRLGIHPATLSAIENGHRKEHSAELIWRMSALYGCPVHMLMEALYGPAGEVQANA